MLVETIFSNAAERWPAVINTHRQSVSKIERLRNALSPVLSGYDDTTVVAFGSLARRETTSGSDVDWAVIHDGRATPSVRDLPRRITGALLASGIQPPAETSEFGKLTSSLDVLDSIASRTDMRLSLSRRMLLILESVSLSGDQVRDRLVCGILDAYRNEETLSDNSVFSVPRYLLNDINQFWRLMCTDYSGLTRARSGKHWGLRSVKLNFSRKLLFVSGVLKCLRCHPEVHPRRTSTKGPRSMLGSIYDAFRSNNDLSPIETVGAFLPNDIGEVALTEYDYFLSALDNPDRRAELANLEFGISDQNQLLMALWEHSRVFHDALVSGIIGDETLGPIARGCLVI